MKFRYLGEHENMRAYGYDFSNNKMPDVPKSDKLAFKKLSNNSHFQAVSDDEAKVVEAEIAKIKKSEELIEAEKARIAKEKEDKKK